MRTFLRSRVIEWTAALMAIYWVLALFVAQGLLSTMITGLLLSGWLGLMVAYWQGVWRTVRDPNSSLPAKLMMLGIAMLALGIVGIFGWSLVYRYLGSPDWMTNHVIRGWFLWIFGIGTSMLLIVGNVGTAALLPGQHWGRLGVIVAICLCITTILLTLAGGLPS